MEVLDLRAAIVQRVFKVIESRRVATLMEDERATSVLVGVLSTPLVLRTASHAMGRRLARRLGLATAEDLHSMELDLTRRIETIRDAEDSPARAVPSPRRDHAD
jgi:hypothetical protein